MSIPAHEAKSRLIEGNKRFINATSNPGDVSLERRVDTLKNGQHPYAIVLCCSDSRQVPEAIFSAGIGELFVIRVAGNVVDSHQLGSIEYAADHLDCKLVVVLGHNHCGAVEAAIKHDPDGHIKYITDDIREAIKEEKDEYIATCLNVKHSVKVIEDNTDMKLLEEKGLVRGATQREVKLEITGNSDDELINYLDGILEDLKYEDGDYNLISLDDNDYKKKLDTQIAFWSQLKDEIYKVREYGYENTNIVILSEEYFHLADQTVSAAENYSERIAWNLRLFETFTAIDMVLIIIFIINQTIQAIIINKKNTQLEKQAFLDLHTGLPNKSKCEEIFRNKEFITDSTACIMFDLNNLKKANDTLGHSVGDQLILNFAKLLRNVVPSKDFVGRYGGDEFIAVIYNSTKDEVTEILNRLDNEISEFNELGKAFKISYAHGCAFSSDYKDCTLKTLFDKADKYMYDNKQAEKAGR